MPNENIFYGTIFAAPAILAVRARRLPFWQLPHLSGGGTPNGGVDYPSHPKGDTSSR